MIKNALLQIKTPFTIHKSSPLLLTRWGFGIASYTKAGGCGEWGMGTVPHTIYNNSVNVHWDYEMAFSLVSGDGSEI
jgi:hypothetical protein